MPSKLRVFVQRARRRAARRFVTTKDDALLRARATFHYAAPRRALPLESAQACVRRDHFIASGNGNHGLADLDEPDFIVVVRLTP